MAQALLLRQAVSDLSTLASADLASMWKSVSTPEDVREALGDILPGLLDVYGSAAATVAADWYDDYRDEVGAAGRFYAITASLEDAGTDALAGWGISPLFGAEPDWAAARTLIEGGLQRRIANAARETITGSSIQDPAARGWKRVGLGHNCEFCNMLLGRGAVYTQATARFHAHDHCNCGAAPEWA